MENNFYFMEEFKDIDQWNNIIFWSYFLYKCFLLTYFYNRQSLCNMHCLLPAE